MTDWQDVLKATVQDRGADIAAAQQAVTNFEKNTLTKEIDAYLKTQPAGTLAAFNIVVNPKAATSGMSGDTYTLGGDFIQKLTGGNTDIIFNTLSKIYTDAKYQVKRGMLGTGKTLKVTIPKTAEAGGKKIIDPRRMAAMQENRGAFGWKDKLRATFNPKYKRTRDFMAQEGNTGQAL